MEDLVAGATKWSCQRYSCQPRPWCCTPTLLLRLAAHTQRRRLAAHTQRAHVAKDEHAGRPRAGAHVLAGSGPPAPGRGQPRPVAHSADARLIKVREGEGLVG
eukprot:401022-Prymnesium_polylepis.1